MNKRKLYIRSLCNKIFYYKEIQHAWFTLNKKCYLIQFGNDDEIKINFNAFYVTRKSYNRLIEKLKNKYTRDKVYNHLTHPWLMHGNKFKVAISPVNYGKLRINTYPERMEN